MKQLTDAKNLDKNPAPPAGKVAGYDWELYDRWREFPRFFDNPYAKPDTSFSQWEPNPNPDQGEWQHCLAFGTMPAF